MSMGTRKLSASDSGTSDTLALVSITAIVDLRLRHTGTVGKSLLIFEVFWTQHPCPVFDSAKLRLLTFG